MSPKSHIYDYWDTAVKQAMSSSSVKSRGEENIKRGIAGSATVTQEMQGVGAEEANKTQPSLNFFIIAITL